MGPIHFDKLLADFIAPALYWTQLECAVAVVCACLPTLGSVFGAIYPERVLRSWASKLSLRSAFLKPQASEMTAIAPGWEDSHTPTTKAASDLSFTGDNSEISRL